MSVVPITNSIAPRGELERLVAKALHRWKRNEVSDHQVAEVIFAAIQREVLEAKGEILAKLGELSKLNMEATKLLVDGMTGGLLDAMIRSGLKDSPT